MSAQSFQLVCGVKRSPDPIALYPYVEPVEVSSFVKHEILLCYVIPEKIEVRERFQFFVVYHDRHISESHMNSTQDILIFK